MTKSPLFHKPLLYLDSINKRLPATYTSTHKHTIHKHTHTHTHAHKRTHTYTHTHMHKHSTLTFVYPRILTRLPTLPHMQTLSQINNLVWTSYILYMQPKTSLFCTQLLCTII